MVPVGDGVLYEVWLFEPVVTWGPTHMLLIMGLLRMDNVLIVVEDLDAAKAFFAEISTSGEDLPLQAASNCVTTSCEDYSASIPGASVTTVGLEHWIEVTDGYVSEQTPIWPTVVR